MFDLLLLLQKTDLENMHPVHLHAFLAANTSKDIRQCTHYYKLPALPVSNKNQENIIINRISQIWGLLPCQTNIINTSVSSSPLARDLVESQLLAGCELIFYSSEFSLWAALLLIKPPLVVLLQSDPFPRHCHLNSHSHCCLNLQSVCHHHHHWICH